MRYSLYCDGTLVGHTDLDIYTVTPTMRQGFIEPTREGKPFLVTATGVWRAMAEQKRAERARGEALPSDLDLVMEAMQRRDRQKLELRDENGEVFECDFMRIYDLSDYRSGLWEEMSDTEEEMEADFQVHLSSLSAEEQQQALSERAEMEAEVEAYFADMIAEREEEHMFGSAWPVEPPDDPRWDTMQYHLQVHLKHAFEHEAE